MSEWKPTADIISSNPDEDFEMSAREKAAYEQAAKHPGWPGAGRDARYKMWRSELNDPCQSFPAPPSEE